MPVRLTSSLPSTRLRCAPPHPHHSFVSPFLIVVGYISLYLALVALGIQFTTPQHTSAWYPPPSLSIALLLTFGFSYAPALFISALLSQYWLHGLRVSPEAHVVIALIIMVGYTAGAAAIQRLLGTSLHIRSTRDVGKFVLVSLTVPFLISSLCVAISALVGFIPWSVYPLAVATWWIGDVLGILVLTPLLLLYVRPWIMRLRANDAQARTGIVAYKGQRSSMPLWEGLGFVLFIGAVLWNTFGQTSNGLLQLFILCLIPLVWVIRQHGLSGAVLGIFAINVGTVLAVSIFDYSLDGVIHIQLLMLVLTLIGLFLGAGVSEHNLIASGLMRQVGELTGINQQLEGSIAERSEVEQTLRQRCAELEGRLQERMELAEVRGTLEVAIAERTKVSSMQREQDQLFQIVVESTRELISLTDSSGRYVYINPFYRAMLGYNPDDLKGTDMRALIHKDDHSHIPWLVHPSMSVEEQPVTLRLRHADGSWRWVEATFTTTCYHDQTYLVTIACDITARREAEAERQALADKLQQTQKLESLGLLAGGIAHDFNNLLGSILGNVGLALLELPPDSPAQESIAQIELATRRAADLIRQLLAYAGKGRLIIQPVDPNAIIKEMVQLLQTTIAKNVALLSDLAPKLPLIEADATEIRQVVMNLIVNAAESIGTRPGAIHIKTSVCLVDRAYLETMDLGSDLTAGQFVRIEVADTGCGMDTITRAKIFEPFFTTKLTGRGLGLAAVLGIIRGHRGALKVDSVPGQGTTFTILLPAKADNVSLDTPMMPLEPRRVRGTILLVDDLVDMRMVARRILKQAGFDVLEAADGQSAIDLLRARSDEIVGVLLDMTMPHLDGRATAALIEQIKPNLPIILMSGYSQQEVAEQFKDQHLAGFLQKPFTAHELQQVLADIFRSTPEA